MPDLMAEMAEQGAVGLAHFGAQFFAQGVVGLVQVDGDQPLIMAGEDVGSGPGRVGQEIEGKPVFGIVG